jgi:predicted dehydrogenase
MDVTRRHFVAALGATNLMAGLALPDEVAQDPKKIVQIGIVGGNFGATWQWHLHPNFKVAAVCDLSDDRLQLLSEVYKCDSKYKSYADMLKQPGLDAVGILTPLPLHVWMATEAMKQGKHVISAVPAGTSEEELATLIDTVKSTGMKYMMGETSYYRPEVITCREWAKQGKFGTIFYSESEYHHEGLLALMFDERGFPTWRHGLPPMHYPTHCVGLVLPVIGERFSEVQAIGWGDKHEVLRTNEYNNPFWNTVGFFRTSRGHSSRISVCWHIAAGETERGLFYGDRMSYIMARPEGSPDTVVQIEKDGKTVMDSNGYPEGKVQIEPYKQPNHWDKLPASMRVKSGHGGSHTFLANEFISAILEDRQPAVNVWEAVAYTLPGIVAHRSALRGGELLKIKDYDQAS